LLYTEPIHCRQIFVNEVVLGTLVGIFIGPYFLGIFDPRSWTHEPNALTLEVMRIVLATGLFAIGVELPNDYMARRAKSLLVMIIPTMAIGWVIVAGLPISVINLDDHEG
jgi:NhaP-type Na+/H+ or K+/H+ antiporter